MEKKARPYKKNTNTIFLTKKAEIGFTGPSRKSC
jgi:hypothetical protein